MDPSIERRKITEYLFTPLVPSLKRIAAVDAQDLAARQQILPDETILVSPLDSNMNRESESNRISDPELAVVLSHLHAIRTAYNDGCQAALIMEDDVSTALMPYWTYTPLQAVRDAEITNPAWTVIQVRMLTRSGRKLPHDNMLKTLLTFWQLGWTSYPPLKLQVDQILQERTYNSTSRLFPVPYALGAFAYLISRRGMELMLDRYMSTRSMTSVLINSSKEAVEYWFEWVRPSNTTIRSGNGS